MDLLVGQELFWKIFKGKRFITGKISIQIKIDLKKQIGEINKIRHNNYKLT